MVADVLRRQHLTWPFPIPMTLRKLLVLPIALAAAGIAALYAARNPEHSDMDAAARQGVPGKFVTLGDGVTHYDVVGPDSGVLTTIVSQDPMYVTFPVSQREFLRAQQTGERTSRGP